MFAKKALNNFAKPGAFAKSSPNFANFTKGLKGSIQNLGQSIQQPSYQQFQQPSLSVSGLKPRFQIDTKTLLIILTVLVFLCVFIYAISKLTEGFAEVDIKDSREYDSEEIKRDSEIDNNFLHYIFGNRELKNIHKN